MVTKVKDHMHMFQGHDQGNKHKNISTSNISKSSILSPSHDKAKVKVKVKIQRYRKQLDFVNFCGTIHVQNIKEKLCIRFRNLSALMDHKTLQLNSMDPLILQ